MKKIPLNEMERIKGGSIRTMCFGLGILTVVSITQPLTIYKAWPAIKYCWDH